VVVILGSPKQVADLVQSLGMPEITCYQLDLYQADRLREELRQRSLRAQVVTSPDLWDLPATFETCLYPVDRDAERSLKLDMVEQAFHVLRPHGTFLVLSPHEQDQLFPGLMKKVFGRVHATCHESGTILWCHREGDRPRRRHEVHFHARIGDEPSLDFVSRPGVFSYGRFDDGARALVETMHIDPGDRILDIGCGSGSNGIFAARKSGPTGQVTFVDSNVRAVAVTVLNAKANGVVQFEAMASASVEGFAAIGFEVVLANPPYYAHGRIADLFIKHARALLCPGGRFYLVTKQPDLIGPIMAEHFGRTEVVERRGYIVLCARISSAFQS
jgi:16S rRNA (guanine1207-N2)-methyltransferase